jgi:hypothetical protein
MARRKVQQRHLHLPAQCRSTRGRAPVGLLEVTRTLVQAQARPAPRARGLLTTPASPAHCRRSKLRQRRNRLTYLWSAMAAPTFCLGLSCMLATVGARRAYVQKRGQHKEQPCSRRKTPLLLPARWCWMPLLPKTALKRKSQSRRGEQSVGPNGEPPLQGHEPSEICIRGVVCGAWPARNHPLERTEQLPIGQGCCRSRDKEL